MPAAVHSHARPRDDTMHSVFDSSRRDDGNLLHAILRTVDGHFGGADDRLHVHAGEPHDHPRVPPADDNSRGHTHGGRRPAYGHAHSDDRGLSRGDDSRHYRDDHHSYAHRHDHGRDDWSGSWDSDDSHDDRRDDSRDDGRDDRRDDGWDDKRDDSSDDSRDDRRHRHNDNRDDSRDDSDDSSSSDDHHHGHGRHHDDHHRAHHDDDSGKQTGSGEDKPPVLVQIINDPDHPEVKRAFGERTARRDGSDAHQIDDKLAEVHSSLADLHTAVHGAGLGPAYTAPSLRGQSLMHHVVNGRPLYQMVREHKRRTDYLKLLHGLFDDDKDDHHGDDHHHTKSKGDDADSSESSSEDLPASATNHTTGDLAEPTAAVGNDDDDETDNRYTRWALYLATVMIFFVCFGHDLFAKGHHHSGHHHGHISGMHHH